MREEFIDFFSLSKKKEGRKENNKFLLTLKNRKLINDKKISRPFLSQSLFQKIK